MGALSIVTRAKQKIFIYLSPGHLQKAYAHFPSTTDAANVFFASAKRREAPLDALYIVYTKAGALTLELCDLTKKQVQKARLREAQKMRGSKKGKHVDTRKRGTDMQKNRRSTWEKDIPHEKSRQKRYMSLT